MNLPAQILGGAAGVLMLLVYVGFIIFWMIVGWRLMRAHENIADAHKKFADSTDEIRHAVRAWFKTKSDER